MLAKRNGVLTPNEPDLYSIQGHSPSDPRHLHSDGIMSTFHPSKSRTTAITTLRRRRDEASSPISFGLRGQYVGEVWRYQRRSFVRSQFGSIGINVVTLEIKHHLFKNLRARAGKTYRELHCFNVTKPSYESL